MSRTLAYAILPGGLKVYVETDDGDKSIDIDLASGEAELRNFRNDSIWFNRIFQVISLARLSKSDVFVPWRPDQCRPSQYYTLVDLLKPAIEKSFPGYWFVGLVIVQLNGALGLL